MYRPRRPLLLALVALGLCAGTGVPVALHQHGYWATPPRAHPSRYTPADAMRLRPGQYAWAPYADDTAPVHIAIDLTNQRAFVFQGSALVGIATVSTGKPGHGTPTGVYPILEKAAWHRSNLYSDAPMPYMQRLTWGGVALHAGYNPGHPASHGCIRLPYGFARVLFRTTQVGGMVVVTRGTPMAEPPRPEVQMAAADAPEEAAVPPPAEAPETEADAPAALGPLPPPPASRVAMISTERSVAVMSGSML
jgi:hypothetical protein